MNTPAWKAERYEKVGKFEARFPENSAPTPLPEYIALTDGKRTAVLRSSTRRGAAGDIIYVASSSPFSNDKPVSFTASKKNKYLWYVLFHDFDSLLGLFGLLIALVGVCIDASLAAGKYYPVLTFSGATLAGVAILSNFLKAPGLVIAFIGLYRKQLM